MKIEALHDRVIVKVDPEEGGLIYLPPNIVAEDKVRTGVVVSVGPGKWEAGVTRPAALEGGERILFGQHSGAKFFNPETKQEYRSFAEHEIYGVLR